LKAFLSIFKPSIVYYDKKSKVPTFLKSGFKKSSAVLFELVFLTDQPIKEMSNSNNTFKIKGF